MHGLSCAMACGIFPDQGPYPRLLNRQVDSYPLYHQQSPTVTVLNFHNSRTFTVVNFSYNLQIPNDICREGNGTPLQYSPGESHGQRSLVGCRPWGREESETTELLPFHFSLSCIGEGNGNPSQCSCLENPRDGGAWWAAVYGVAQSRT